MHPLWFERDAAGNTVEVYAVDSLLDRKEENGQVSYYVKWVGFDDERYHTWEPRESLLSGGGDVRRMVAVSNADNLGFINSAVTFRYFDPKETVADTEKYLK
ncbi:hypothetical protein ABPG75_011877, partial [Micractinium tetrahymenae]